MHCKIH